MPGPVGGKPSRFDPLTKKSVILLTLCASPLFFAFLYFGDPGRGRAAMGGAALIILCARMFWDLRTDIWFWLAVMIAAVCNAALVMVIPWNNTDYPGIVTLPVALPDFVLVYGVFKLGERMSGHERVGRTTDV